MGKRELAGTEFEKTPSIGLTMQPGSKFTGKLLGSGKEYKNSSGHTKWIYEFEIHDTTAPTTIKNDDGSYSDVDVEQYQRVAVFATGPLDKKLKQAKVGEVIEIEYKGKKPQKKGNPFHDFIVSVVE